MVDKTTFLTYKILKNLVFTCLIERLFPHGLRKHYECQTTHFYGFARNGEHIHGNFAILFVVGNLSYRFFSFCPCVETYQSQF